VVPDQVPELETALTTFYQEWKEGKLSPPSVEHCDQFKNINLTKQLLNIFQQCARP
jgi:hypothetical protein